MHYRLRLKFKQNGKMFYSVLWEVSAKGLYLRLYSTALRTLLLSSCDLLPDITFTLGLLLDQLLREIWF